MSATEVTTSCTVTAEVADAALRPRTKLVGETGRGSGRYGLDEGPFRSYERRVVVEHLPDGRVHLTQTVRFELALRYWAAMFRWPMSRTLGRIGADVRPWWAPPDRLDSRATEVLGLLCAASLIVGFLASAITQTITFAVDEFGDTNRAQGIALAATRSSALLTLPVVVLADRIGRRRIIVAGLWLGPILAATGALAPDLTTLAATQTITRAVALAVGITIGIMLAEEMPAGSRAYAISLLSMAGALGVGIVLGALPLADLGPSAWRLVFAVSLLGIPLAIDIGRRLPESRRFGTPHIEAPVAGHGRRFWLLAASGLLVGLFGAPASQFQNEFLRDELGYSAGRISLFSVLTNTPGSIGIVVGGRLADTRGRRQVAAVGLAGGTLATVAMFYGSGWAVWGWSLAGAIVGAATIPALGVYGPELFPTSLRGKLNGIITVISLVGSVAGLVAVGILSDRFDSFGPAFALMAVGPLLLAALVLIAYPETAGMTLEELNPEDAPPPPVAELVGPPEAEAPDDGRPSEPDR